MKKISQWAHYHKGFARFLVIAIKLALILMACYAGIELRSLQLQLPVYFILLSAIASVATAILYPSRKFSLSKHSFYVRQKTCDFILSASTFIIILTLANNKDLLNPSLFTNTLGSIIKKEKPKAEDILAALPYRNKNSLTHVEKRVLKKEFFGQLKKYAAAKISNNKEKSDHAAAIILTIIAAVGLLFLLAALVCNLSCYGYDAAAAIVGILGLAGIIWGTIAIINNIKKKK